MTVEFGIPEPQTSKRPITIRLNPKELDITPEIPMAVKLKVGSNEQFFDLDIPIVVLDLPRETMP